MNKWEAVFENMPVAVITRMVKATFVNDGGEAMAARFAGLQALKAKLTAEQYYLLCQELAA